MNTDSQKQKCAVVTLDGKQVRAILDNSKRPGKKPAGMMLEDNTVYIERIERDSPDSYAAIIHAGGIMRLPLYP